MSVAIATMGMYNVCCPQEVNGGGGYIVRKEEEEVVKPLILIKKVIYEKDGEMLKDIIKIRSII